MNTLESVHVFGSSSRCVIICIAAAAGGLLTCDTSNFLLVKAGLATRILQKHWWVLLSALGPQLGDKS